MAKRRAKAAKKAARRRSGAPVTFDRELGRQRLAAAGKKLRALGRLGRRKLRGAGGSSSGSGSKSRSGGGGGG